MPELSNLLRQRLGLGQTPTVDHALTGRGTLNGTVNGEVAHSPHPDADTLNAYTERLLRADERNRVLRHLADCSQCREIVMLSLPETEVGAKAPVKLPAVRGWRLLFKPGLGLAASAVAAVVIGVVLELPRKHVAPVQNANQIQDKQIQTAPGAAIRAIQPTPAPPVAPAPPLVANNNLGATATRLEAKPKNLASVRPPAARANQTVEVFDLRGSASSAATSAPPANIAGFVADDRQNYINEAMFASPAAPGGSSVAQKDLPPAPAPRVPNAWNTIHSTPVPDFAGLPGGERHTLTPVRPPSRSFVSGVIGPAQRLFQKLPPLSANSFAFNNTMSGSQLNPAKEQSQSVEITAASPAVETDAELAASPAFTRRARESANLAAAETSSAAPVSSWKVAGGKLLRTGDPGSWIEAYPGDGIDFSTFTAHGADIWAGGHDAALIHSRDGGTTWERITLGASASGTIVKIEASGLNVQVLSSSGQSWTSVDGGKIWARQE